MKIDERWWLTRAALNKLFTSLEELGFERIQFEKVIAEIKKSGSKPFLKKKWTGFERGYSYEYKHWGIFFWTTYVDAINDVNEQDYIWIGITDNRNGARTFFWFPLKRTVNFVAHATAVAKAAIEMIRSWPRCEECDEYLYLRFDRERGPYKKIENLMDFICGNSYFVHTKYGMGYYPVFDIPLSDESHKVLYDAFVHNLLYQHKKSQSEKPVESARQKRFASSRDAQRKWHEKNNQYGDIKTHHGTSEYND